MRGLDLADVTQCGIHENYRNRDRRIGWLICLAPWVLAGVGLAVRIAIK